MPQAMPEVSPTLVLQSSLPDHELQHLMIGRSIVFTISSAQVEPSNAFRIIESCLTQEPPHQSLSGRPNALRLHLASRKWPQQPCNVFRRETSSHLARAPKL